MDFIRRNKFTIIAIVSFLVLVILLVQVKNIFFPNMGKAIYGDRLNGVKEVELSSKDLSLIKDTLKETDHVTKVSTIVSGRLVNIIATVNDELGMDQAKELAGISIKDFTDEEKKFYDFQIFIQKANDASDFPIIGYKHHNKEAFSWTRDRTVSE